MKIKIILIFLTVASFRTAAQSSLPKDFKKTNSGLVYKIVTDAKKPKAQVNSIVKMNAVYSTQRDSVIFSTFLEGMGPIQQTITAPTFNGDPMEAFVMLGEGDSAIIHMPADSAFKHQDFPPFAKRGDYIKIGVKILSVMSKEEYEQKKNEEAKQQTSMETTTIQDYLTKNNLQAQQTASGLYYVIEKQGDGEKAEAGKTVTVNYTGKLLDGKVFDSSLNPGRTPFSFPLGQGR
ncbi:MAG: FKBP-type peptidyl-prolyl cis-trans isomerase, partial [Chitinophagales bacterium]